MLKGVWPNSQLFSNYSAPKQGTLKLKTASTLRKILVTKQHFVETCDLNLTMLDTNSAHDP